MMNPHHNNNNNNNNNNSNNACPRPQCHVATCHTGSSFRTKNRSHHVLPVVLIILLSSIVLCVTQPFHHGVFVVVVVVEGKIDRNAPHGHRGKLNPYTPGPFLGLTLTSDDEMTLERGESVMKQTLPSDGSSSGGTAICVQDVQAPVTAVWAQILHMEEYPKKVNKVLKCENYHVAPTTHSDNNDDNTKKNKKIRIKTKQVLGVLPGYSYESYYDHTFHPEHSSLTWNLDYDKTSDMDDVSGHWHVTEHPIKGPTHSRVYYACDIIMKGHVPKPIFNYISQAALKQATSWVKRESEAHPERTVGSELAGDLIPAASSSTTDPAAAVTGTTATTSERPRRRGWFFSNA